MVGDFYFGRWFIPNGNGSQRLYIYVSSDYGETWSPKDSIRPWQTVAISASGKYQTAARYIGDIYVSSDYGNTWAAAAVTSGVWKSGSSIAVSADGSKQIAVNNYGSGSGGYITYSSDYGANWNYVNDPNNVLTKWWTAAAISADGVYQVAVGSDNYGSPLPQNGTYVYVSVTETTNFLGAVGIGTTSPTSALDIETLGTVKSNLDIFEVTNTDNAVDMDNTRTSFLFNQYYYDAVTPYVADAGRITVGTESDWTSTAATQNSYLSISTALGGTVAEKMRLTSDGYLGIGTTSPRALLTVGSSTPAYLTSGEYYNSAYIGGQLEVGGLATSTFAGDLNIFGKLGIGTTTDANYGLKLVSNTDTMFFRGVSSPGGRNEVHLSGGNEDYFRIESYSSTSIDALAEMGTYSIDNENRGVVYVNAQDYAGGVYARMHLNGGNLGMIRFDSTGGVLFENSATSTFMSNLDIQGTATSTFAGNLDVAGNIEAAVMYPGDLIFANAFKFYEDPKPENGINQEGPQSLKLTNQLNEDILTIDDQGNLTIKGKLTQATSTQDSVISLGLSWILDQFKTIGVTIADGVMNLKSLIVSDEVCIGSTCINEEQLKEIINQNGVVQPASAVETPQGPVTVPDSIVTPEVAPDATVAPEATPVPVVDTTPVEAPVI